MFNDVKNTIPDDLMQAATAAELRLDKVKEVACEQAPKSFKAFQLELWRDDETSAKERVSRASRKPGRMIEELAAAGHAGEAQALAEYGAAEWAADAAAREIERQQAGGFIPVPESSGLRQAQREASDRSRRDRIRWAVRQHGGKMPACAMSEDEKKARAHERAMWKREQTAEIVERMEYICAMPYHMDPALEEAESVLARLTPKRKAIITYLLDVSADTSTVWASTSTIAKATGTNRSTVCALMRELEAEGVLRRIRTGGKNLATGRTASNVYRLHHQRLRDLLGIKLRGSSKYALPAPNKLSVGFARAAEEARCFITGHPIPHNPFHSPDGMVTGRQKIAGFWFNRYRRCWWNLAFDLHFPTLTLTGKRNEENLNLLQMFTTVGGARRAARAERELKRQEARRKTVATEAFYSSWPDANRDKTQENGTSEPLTSSLPAETQAYDPDPKWLRQLAVIDKQLADNLAAIATPMTVDEWNILDDRMKRAGSLLAVRSIAADFVTSKNV